MTMPSCPASMAGWFPGWSWLRALTRMQGPRALTATRTCPHPLRGQAALGTPGPPPSIQMLPVAGTEWTMRQAQSLWSVTGGSEPDVETAMRLPGPMGTREGIGGGTWDYLQTVHPLY